MTLTPPSVWLPAISGPEDPVLIFRYCWTYACQAPLFPLLKNPGKQTRRHTRRTCTPEPDIRLFLRLEQCLVFLKVQTSITGSRPCPVWYAQTFKTGICPPLRAPAITLPVLQSGHFLILLFRSSGHTFKPLANLPYHTYHHHEQPRRRSW